MSRRLIVLSALTLLAVLAATLAFSSASFTSTSTTTVMASTDSVAGWLNLYSSESDPIVANRAGYAHQDNDPGLPFVASGLNDTLAIDWGSYPDSNTTYTFNRSFTLSTAGTLPAAQVTVRVSYLPGDGETQQPIQSALINTLGSKNGSSSVTMGPDMARQLNVRVRARRQWQPGEVYHPTILVTLTYPGGPADYYVYTVPTVVTVE